MGGTVVVVRSGSDGGLPGGVGRLRGGKRRWDEGRRCGGVCVVREVGRRKVAEVVQLAVAVGWRHWRWNGGDVGGTGVGKAAAVYGENGSGAYYIGHEVCDGFFPIADLRRMVVINSL
ncbi:hypothetical protein Droror1_Dr00002711 [Drosera rotundifolia]